MSRGTWTEERVAILRQHWRDSTPLKIAKLLGVSENSVRGKAWRMKLEPKKKKGPVASRCPRKHEVPKSVAAAKMRRCRSIPVPDVANAAVSTAHTCTWLDGNGPYIRCEKGSEVRRNRTLPFCPYHARIAYVGDGHGNR